MVIRILVVLAGAGALGYGIRQIRWSLAISRNLSQSKPQTQVMQSEPESETVPEPEVEVVETDATTREEPVLEEEPEDQPMPDVGDDTQSQLWLTDRKSGPSTQGLGDWRSVWAGLDLTQEERGRLREGWRLAVAGWQNMSQEERQSQTERMRASWEKWRNMSDQEKEQASWELRQRIEDWRQSGSTELPDLFLD
jgi:hypothetical protein